MPYYCKMIPIYKIKQINIADVIFHSELTKSFVLSKPLANTIHEQYLPIFVAANDKYILVGRQWVFAYNIAQTIDPFPALIYPFEAVEKLLIHDRFEVAMLLKSTTAVDRLILDNHPKQTYSCTVVKSWRENKKANQICPFCKAPLKRKKTKSPDGKIRCVISCSNKYRKNKYHCNFFSIITQYEYQQFVAHQLPTKLWIEYIADSKCPTCGAKLMLRSSKSATALYQHIECENYHRYKDKVSLKSICRYRIKMDAN